MNTIQDIIGDYTPLSNNVVKKIKLVRGALACKIFFTSNLNDRVCRMGLTRIANDLGIERSTASKNITWLVKHKYIEVVKEYTPMSPAHYRCTQKFYDLAQDVLGVDLINTPIDDVNTPIDDVNTSIDLINQEEEIKKESEQEGEGPLRDEKEKKKSIVVDRWQLIARHIAISCQYDLELLRNGDLERAREKCDNAGKKLDKRGATPDDVDAHNKWWYTSYWIGRDKKEPPTQDQILETWGQFLAVRDKPEPTRTNGHAPPVTPEQLERARRMAVQDEQSSFKL